MSHFVEPETKQCVPIVLVTGTDGRRKDFGTGFVVARDPDGCYILTCAHVIDEVGGAEKHVQVATKDAQIVQCGDSDFDDLALLRVPGLVDLPSLAVQVTANEGDSFAVCGYQRHENAFQYKRLDGTLKTHSILISQDQQRQIDAWDLGLGLNPLQFGYSGSPVIDSRTGAVIGVASEKIGDGRLGLAISMSSALRILNSLQNVEYIDPPHSIRTQDRQTVTSVQEGLGVVSGLMSDPTVHEAIYEFQADFRSTRQEIERVANFKDVHDQLDNLQIHCCDRISAEIERFPDDPTSEENLAQHALTLQEIIDRLRRLKTCVALSDVLGRCIPELERSQVELQKALDTRDVLQLKKACALLYRIPGQYLPQLNTRLLASAEMLRLQPLAVAMNRIDENYRRKVSSTLSSDDQHLLRDGISALGRLENSFPTLIEEHNGWQQIDIMLRRIAVTLEHDMDELVLSWPDMKEQAQALLGSSNEPWVNGFLDDSHKLEVAITAANHSQCIKAFALYRRRSTLRFSSVDISLKTVCDELRTVGEQIDRILEKLA